MGSNVLHPQWPLDLERMRDHYEIYAEFDEDSEEGSSPIYNEMMHAFNALIDELGTKTVGEKCTTSKTLKETRQEVHDALIEFIVEEMSLS